MVHHLKALIFSSLEPEGQRTWPPNKAATPSWMKLELFSLKGTLFGGQPSVLLAPRNWISGLSNEVHYVSELPVVPKIRAAKVERTENNSIQGLPYTANVYISSTTAIKKLLRLWLNVINWTSDSCIGHKYQMLVSYRCCGYKHQLLYVQLE